VTISPEADAREAAVMAGNDDSPGDVLIGALGDGASIPPAGTPTIGGYSVISATEQQLVRERYVQVDAVAEHLGMSRKWVLNRTRRLDDPLPCKNFGRSVRFLLSEVDAWALRQKRGAS
jgi:predicted DNA-binding transcriptional regulator AlpA